AKGKQSGECWDKVNIENGIVGYIYQTYVTEVPEAQIEKIEGSIDNQTLKKGERKQLTVTISPEEARNHSVEDSSSNAHVAIVDDKGNVRTISSGTTTITVKAKGNNVQGKLDITVYSPVTGISLDQSERYMAVGDVFQIYA